MTQILVILISLTAVIVLLFSLLWGWLILAVPAGFLLISLVVEKMKRWPKVPELSEAANRMLEEFGHYYAMPFAGRDFSSSASTLMFAGGALGIVSVLEGFWWGIGLGILNWFVMGYVARAFNPSVFLRTAEELAAHEEVINWITNSQRVDIDQSEQRISAPENPVQPETTDLKCVTESLQDSRSFMRAYKNRSGIFGLVSVLWLSVVINSLRAVYYLISGHSGNAGAAFIWGIGSFAFWYVIHNWALRHPKS